METNNDTVILVDAIAQYLETPNNPQVFQTLVLNLRIWGIDVEPAIDRLNTTVDRFYPAIVTTTR